MLVWAIQTFVTTFTCVVEVWSWADRTTDQKMNISLLYVPYMIFGELIPLYSYIIPLELIKRHSWTRRTRHVCPFRKRFEETQAGLRNVVFQRLVYGIFGPFPYQILD